MKKTIMVIAVVVSLLAALLWWLAPAKDGQAESAAELVALSGSTGEGSIAPPTRFQTGVEALPRSLQGTEVDGELEVDAQGRLKITHGIRRVFDYFLSAVGEEPMASIIARLRAYIRHQLPAGAAAEAERILDGYLAYKQGLEGLQARVQQSDGSLDIAAVRRQMQEVQALRTQYLAADVIAAFFGDDDLYDRYTLSRLDILQNKTLTTAQRAQQLAALEQQLPPALQESLTAINQYQNLQALTDEWKQRGGSPAELRQLRESLVGAEATDRLETLDRERGAWDQRMSGWLAERAAILGNRNLSETDRQHQMAAARAQRFSADEQSRVQSLELMHDRGETVPGS
ncbi:MAG: lipase secretion chaperone [Moraxellaceae bacterium]|nr:lipase secretion chaperone [Moraxellaceae bacterium]